MGVAYSQTLSATGGTAPRMFALAAGTLPTGFALSGATIAGTPTTARTKSFSITATSADGIVGITEVTSIPEPAVLALGVPLMALLGFRRKRTPPHLK